MVHPFEGNMPLALQDLIHYAITLKRISLYNYNVHPRIASAFYNIKVYYKGGNFYYCYSIVFQKALAVYGVNYGRVFEVEKYQIC